MMLRELVDSLPDDWAPRAIAFPAVCRTAEACLKLQAVKERREVPQLELSAGALDRLRQRLELCHRCGDWAPLLPRDWRYANECLAIGEPRLIDDLEFTADFLLALATHRPTPSSANLLARWYVRNFEPGHAGLRLIGAHLTENSHRLRPGWINLHDRCGLFDPDAALPALAALFCNDEAGPAEILRALSCPPSILSSRLFGYVFLSVCQMIAGMPPKSACGIQNLAAWAFGGKDIFQYRGYPDAEAIYAEALLRPWTGSFPGEEIRTTIVPQLLGLMQDPRINRAGWAKVSEPARRVMLSWMTKDSLEQFLEVVDDTIQAYQSRMWAERRDFWLSHYERHYIQECWVVFGRRGAALARHLAVAKRNPSLMHYATFLAELGGDPNQAVLLMKIGSLVIADWSHNGRCHIWLPDNPSAPQLYQPEYIRDDLMSGADFEAPHHKSWQEGVDKFIASHLHTVTLNG